MDAFQPDYMKDAQAWPTILQASLLIRRNCGGSVTYGQGSFLFHSQNMTVAARATAERKTFGHLS